LSAAEAPALLTCLPPIVDERTRVLVLGSFPGEQSLIRQQYYGHPQNAFWRLVDALFGVPASAPNPERTAALLAHGIGLWDVIAACHREGSADTAIANEAANDVPRLLDQHPGIRHVVFNGGKSWHTAQRLIPQLFRRAGLTAERFPSTSPAHAVPFARKLEAWWLLKVWTEA